MVDLSVIILTLNNKKILEDCISSIILFTKDITYEIIVVDNGSSDGSQDMVRLKYPSIKLLANKVNLGFGRANNNGIKVAQGRYALILNDDTYLAGNAFSQMVKHMDSDSNIGIAGPKLLNPDGSIQRQGSIFSSFKWSSKYARKVSFVIGACMFIRMSAIQKIGMFDENLFFYNEDMDICKRARAAGFNIVYFPDASIYHYGGYSSKGGFKKTMLVEGFRGGLYYCRKHYGIPVYQFYRILLYFFVLLALPFSLLNREKLAAYIEILGIIKKEQIIFKYYPV